MSLSDYIKAFRSLNVSKGKLGVAPHKPILLLAVIDLIAEGFITDGKVYLIPELIILFENHWNRRVKTKHTPKFELPFFHMRKEPFWELIPLPGKEFFVTNSHSIRSRKALREALDHVRLDPVLFHHLTQPEDRNLLRAALIKGYNLAANDGEDLPGHTAQEYQARYGESDGFVKIERRQRPQYFATQIKRIYDHTCAMTHQRITATANLSMVDACHIVPHSDTRDNSLTNGIALSPTLHRAFDRGLVSVDEDYRVLVSPHFEEEPKGLYRLRDLTGKKIYLPENPKLLPSPSALASHREMWGF